VRRGHSTRIKIPSGMRQGFGNKKGKGKWTYIFRRKKWNEEQQVGKSDVKGGSGLRICPCPFKRIVREIVTA